MPYQVSSDSDGVDGRFNDNRTNTYVEFVTNEASNQVELTFTYPQPITTNPISAIRSGCVYSNVTIKLDVVVWGN